MSECKHKLIRITSRPEARRENHKSKLTHCEKLTKLKLVEKKVRKEKLKEEVTAGRCCPNSSPSTLWILQRLTLRNPRNCREGELAALAPAH